jgi:hypothetical protein
MSLTRRGEWANISKGICLHDFLSLQKNVFLRIHQGYGVRGCLQKLRRVLRAVRGSFFWNGYSKGVGGAGTWLNQSVQATVKNSRDHVEVNGFLNGI